MIDPTVINDYIQTAILFGVSFVTLKHNKVLTLIRQKVAIDESITGELKKNTAIAELVGTQLKNNAAENESTAAVLRKNVAETESIICELRRNAAGTESIICELKKKATECYCEISQTSKEISEINKEIANKQLNIETNKLEYLKREYEYKKNYLEKVKDSSDEISHRISKNLVDDPSWLDRFMEQTGATYGGSLFGNRINHFYYEKKLIARIGVDYLDNKLLIPNSDKRYCFLIDSGTTMYHFFYEICERMKNDEFKARWSKQVCIVTNNLPGIQYLMKHCKDKIYDEYSEIVIPCFLLPGKPLSVYGAVTGDEACEWLEKKSLTEYNIDLLTEDKADIRNNAHKTQQSKMETYLNELWGVDRKEYEIITLMSANYIVRQPYPNQKDSYYPVARGEGHTKIKYRFSEVADKIFIFSPLTKFSFATVDELNTENQLEIDEFEPSKKFKTTKKAKINPSKVKYNLIEIEGDKEKCTFFTTKRVKGNLFHGFSDALIARLSEYYSHVETVDFDIKHSIPDEDRNENYQLIQIEKEIPHRILREKYITKKDSEPYIWDTAWIMLHANKD